MTRTSGWAAKRASPPTRTSSPFLYTLPPYPRPIPTPHLNTSALPRLLETRFNRPIMHQENLIHEGVMTYTTTDHPPISSPCMVKQTQAFLPHPRDQSTAYTASRQARDEDRAPHKRQFGPLVPEKARHGPYHLLHDRPCIASPNTCSSSVKHVW